MIEALRSAFGGEAVVVLALVSIVTFVLGIAFVPLWLTRIPPDYYVRAERPRLSRSPLRVAAVVLRNLAGALLVLLGVVLLVLPGQGVLTILLGFSLLSFPGRRRLELRILGRRRVLEAVNALRRRAGRPPLEIPHRQ